MDVTKLTLPVTIAIDALSPKLTGIGRYCWELCVRIPQHELIKDVKFYRDGTIFQDPSEFLNDGVSQNTRFLRSKLIRTFRARSLRRHLNRSIFHSPNFFLPEFIETGIVTVHDLSVFVHPDAHPAARVKQFTEEFNRSIEKSTYVLTDSETMRHEIISHTGIAPSKVVTTYMGVSTVYHPRTELEIFSTLSKYKLTYGSYALCVSTLEPRKRIASLIHAWRLLPAALRNAYPLVLIGASGWENEELMEDIANAQCEGWLIFLGFVPETDLPELYSGASLFLYPSIYEGFGLPPIEAMASGVPTIVSNTSCLPEVTRGASKLVNPDDIESFSSEIRQGLEDEKWRDVAHNRGLITARGYSWEACIEKTINCYLNFDQQF